MSTLDPLAKDVLLLGRRPRCLLVWANPATNAEPILYRDDRFFDRSRANGAA